MTRRHIQIKPDRRQAIAIGVSTVMMTLYAFSHFLVFDMQLGKLFRRVVGCPSRFRAWVFFHEPSPFFHLCTVRPNLDGLTSSAEPTLMNFPSLTATASAQGFLIADFATRVRSPPYINSVNCIYKTGRRVFGVCIRVERRCVFVATIEQALK